MKYPGSIAVIVLLSFVVVSFLPAGYYALQASTTPFDSSPIDVVSLPPIPACFIDDGMDIRLDSELQTKKRKHPHHHNYRHEKEA